MLHLTLALSCQLNKPQQRLLQTTVETTTTKKHRIVNPVNCHNQGNARGSLSPQETGVFITVKVREMI